jgi:hypothetical protein
MQPEAGAISRKVEELLRLEAKLPAELSLKVDDLLRAVEVG